MQIPNQPAPGLGSMSDSGRASPGGERHQSGHRQKQKSSIELFVWFAITVALILASDSPLETPLLVASLVASLWIFGRRARSRT